MIHGSYGLWKVTLPDQLALWRDEGILTHSHTHTLSHWSVQQPCCCDDYCLIVCLCLRPIAQKDFFIFQAAVFRGRGFVSRRVWWFAVWDVEIYRFVFVWGGCRYNACSTCPLLLLHCLVVTSCFFFWTGFFKIDFWRWWTLRYFFLNGLDLVVCSWKDWRVGFCWRITSFRTGEENRPY